MERTTKELEKSLRALVDRFDALAAREGVRPRVYLIGAGSLILEGLTTRATRDLDFICEPEGRIFENQVLPSGFHSHRVPSGLVSMPAGWRERSREVKELGTKHVSVLIPDIHDRLLDKLSRGLATDWQDINDVFESRPRGLSGVVLAERANGLLRNPVSSVFEPDLFRESFARLRQLASKTLLAVPDLSA